MTGQPTPALTYPPRKKMLNKALLVKKALFLGGMLGGPRLTSRDTNSSEKRGQHSELYELLYGYNSPSED